MVNKHRLMTLVMLLLFSVVFPLNVYAYSDYILAGGDNIGIQLNSDGVLIVGTYKINGKDPAMDANLMIGDKIVAINDLKIGSIDDMLDV